MTGRTGSDSFDALIVDFGGVLTTPLQDAMASFADALGIELQDLVRVALAAYSGGDDELVTRFETGRISEEEFAASFAERLSEVTGRPIDHRDLVRNMFRVELEEEMLDAVGAARRAGLKTGMLSNSWGSNLYPRRRLEELFDTVVISGEVGLRKPDPAIFELTADRLGVVPRACLFVDDHPGHLAAASELGMATLLHRSPAETIEHLQRLLGVTLR